MTGFCSFALTGVDMAGAVCETSVDFVDPEVYALQPDGLYLFKGNGAKVQFYEDLDVNLKAAETNYANFLADLTVDYTAVVNSNSVACIEAVTANYEQMTSSFAEPKM